MTLKKNKKKKIDITLIVWYDAVAETGWTSKEDAKKTCQLAECVSVGHIVDKNKDRILLACTKSEDEYNAMINIPNAWIKEIKEYHL